MTTREYEPNRVYMADVRVIETGRKKPGFCVKGTREWCERYGFDFRELVRGGLDADAVLATGDAFAARAVEQMRKREQNGRREEQ